MTVGPFHGNVKGTAYAKGTADLDPDGGLEREEILRPEVGGSCDGQGGEASLTGVHILTTGRSQPNSCLLTPMMYGTWLKSFSARMSLGIFGSSSPSTTVGRKG